MLLFLVNLCLAVAVQPSMEWIPIKKYIYIQTYFYYIHTSLRIIILACFKQKKSKNFEGFALTLVVSSGTSCHFTCLGHIWTMCPYLFCIMLCSASSFCIHFNPLISFSKLELLTLKNDLWRNLAFTYIKGY